MNHEKDEMQTNAMFEVNELGKSKLGQYSISAVTYANFRFNFFGKLHTIPVKVCRADLEGSHLSMAL